MARRKCERCHGEGWVTNTDIMKARTTKEKCKECGGTGYQDPDRLEIEAIKGKSFWIKKHKNDKLVSWAKVRLIPVMNAVTGERHLVWEIDHIETKKDYRCQGHAAKIIDKMKHAFKGEVKYIMTGWRDSSQEAKAMLKRCAFEREGDWLIWKRT